MQELDSRASMDCHEILKSLTNFEESATTPIQDERLREALRTAYSLISENTSNGIKIDRERINNDDDAGWQYLHLILHTIKTLCDTELSEENPLLTVGQFRTIKSAVQIVACIGIIPSLLPQIRAYASKINSKHFVLKLDNDGILEKHKKLSYTVNILMDCFDKIIFRPALISQLSCLLAALLQLSYAPLKKPDVQIDTSAQNSEFSMTIELYTQLTKEQEIFREKLLNLIENCPQSQLIKELMVILGIKNNPKWLQSNIRRILTGRIVLANGIGALAVAICDEVSDLGKCWDKLDITAQLVATSHGSNFEDYYNSVCPQILEMFVSDDNKQKICIANCCIKALYDYKPDLCAKKIIHVIMEPFLVRYNVKHPSLIKTEDEVSQSVKNLCKLFISTDAEFKCIPVSVLSRVALPLFYLHIKSFKSVYILRNQVRQLLMKILSEESIRETIFSAFLGHQEYKNYEFGEKLCFRFGTNGGFEITSESASSTDYEELADCLFDLIEKDGNLAFGMFTYLLKTLPKLNDTNQKVQEGKLIETTEDAIGRIEKQVIAVKILTLLSSSTKVQEAQINNPQPFLEFIEFFFRKVISNSKSDDASAYEQDSSILYTSLMLIKIILTDGNVKPTWTTFQNFVTSIKQQFDFKLIPDHICSIFEEIESIVEKRGKFYSKNYVDLSVNSEKLNEFDKAVADLADPLLPVRAHGIVALTKLIELRHPEVIAKEDFLLCIFQENLNHDDSFIYLAAINGICAMSSMFPEKVIEILVQEFIGMTTKASNRDIFPETRAKLGEILVKTTRALGDMTPKYKSLLVNGFLCGTRDLDPLVRSSSLSCLGEFCKIMGFRLGNLIIEILYCIGCIIKTDKDDGCRRAAVLVATLLLRGLGKDALTELGENLVILYRSLKHLRDNDKDPVLQLHAQLALEEFDDIVQQFLFAKPKLEKSIFLLSN